MLITAGFVSVFLIILTVIFFSYKRSIYRRPKTVHIAYNIGYPICIFLYWALLYWTTPPKGGLTPWSGGTALWEGWEEKDGETVLLHYGGFCNNCTPKRCLHISVHFLTNALQNTLFTQRLYMKSPKVYESYITLFCLEKNKLFYNII